MRRSLLQKKILTELYLTENSMVGRIYSVTVLSKRIEASLSVVSKSLTKIEKEGLVKWEDFNFSVEDGRSSSFLKLTPKGKTEADEYVSAIFNLFPSKIVAKSFLKEAVKYRYGVNLKDNFEGL